MGLVCPVPFVVLVFANEDRINRLVTKDTRQVVRHSLRPGLSGADFGPADFGPVDSLIVLC